METVKKWYSFAENGAYSGPEPAFFNILNKQWAALLQSKHSIILKEFEAVLNSRNKNVIPYFNKNLASRAENWTVFPLYLWGNKQAENCAQCPQTTSIIESIPAMTNCLFSILKPNTSIKPHFGDSNVMYRCHFTLKSPGIIPEIGMRVKNEQISWTDGDIFAFCDAHEHEVWNNTNEERWVLIIDILREEFAHERKKICAEVNATLWWQLKLQKTNVLYHLPASIRKLMLKATAFFF
jgi:aspartyl/asparaginyl beta-hydroxylase (cupin superfamily)